MALLLELVLSSLLFKKQPQTAVFAIYTWMFFLKEMFINMSESYWIFESSVLCLS